MIKPKEKGAHPAKSQHPYSPLAASIFYLLAAPLPRRLSMDGYFSYLASDKAMLRRYGLTAWPTEQQLATIVFDLDAKYTALFKAIGYFAEKDARGRWLVYRTEEVH